MFSCKLVPGLLVTLLDLITLLGRATVDIRELYCGKRFGDGEILWDAVPIKLKSSESSFEEGDFFGEG